MVTACTPPCRMRAEGQAGYTRLLSWPAATEALMLPASSTVSFSPRSLQSSPRTALSRFGCRSRYRNSCNIPTAAHAASARRHTRNKHAALVVPLRCPTCSTYSNDRGHTFANLAWLLGVLWEHLVRRRYAKRRKLMAVACRNFEVFIPFSMPVPSTFSILWEGPR